MSRLKINTLGNLNIFLDDKSIKENLSYKGIALLTYLAVNKGKFFNRDKLAYLFWDSSNSDAARYNLRYTLWALRKAIKDNKNATKFIVTQKDDCQLNPNSEIQIDVLELEKLIDLIENSSDKPDLTSFKRIKDIYNGEFLEGFYVKGCIEFNDWIFYERERLQRKYFYALNKLASKYKSQKKYFESVEIYEEMLKINPLQEELYVELMKIYLELGNTKFAINQYERCCKILREELNISPKDSTKEIYKQILKNNSYHESKSHIEVGESTLKDEGLRKKLCIDCYPINDIPYYSVSKIVEELMDNLDKFAIKDIQTYYWKDIYRIQPKVAEIVEGINCCDCLTSQTEKNRIFIALAKLLYEVTIEKELVIEIKNFQWIDKVSFEFLKYFLLLYSNVNIKLIIYCEKNIKDNNIEELMKCFKADEKIFKKLDIIEL